MSKKYFIIILIIIAVLVVVGGIIYYRQNSNVSGNNNQNSNDETADWRTYKNTAEGIEMKYPETFVSLVWGAQSWPPKVTVLGKNDNPLKGCGDAIFLSGQIESQENKIINNEQYTVYKGSDGAMGHIYPEYCYILKKNNKYYVIDFAMSIISGCGNGGCGPLCGNNDDAERACKNFNIITEIEQPIEKIVSTLKFTK